MLPEWLVAPFLSPAERYLRARSPRVPKELRPRVLRRRVPPSRAALYLEDGAPRPTPQEEAAAVAELEAQMVAHGAEPHDDAVDEAAEAEWWARVEAAMPLAREIAAEVVADGVARHEDGERRTEVRLIRFRRGPHVLETTTTSPGGPKWSARTVARGDGLVDDVARVVALTLTD